MDNQNDSFEKEATTATQVAGDPNELPAEEDTLVETQTAEIEMPSSDSNDQVDIGTGNAVEAPVSSDEPPTPKKERRYSGKTLFFALFFFVLTIGCFLFYALAGGTFLYNLLVTLKEKSVDKTVAGIFGTILALPFMIIFGIAQFPTNIISMILLKRVAGKANARWKNVLFGIFYGLSIFTFVALFLLAGGVIAAAILG